MPSSATGAGCQDSIRDSSLVPPANPALLLPQDRPRANGSTEPVARRSLRSPERAPRSPTWPGLSPGVTGEPYHCLAAGAGAEAASRRDPDRPVLKRTKPRPIRARTRSNYLAGCVGPSIVVDGRRAECTNGLLGRSPRAATSQRAIGKRSSRGSRTHRPAHARADRAVPESRGRPQAARLRGERQRRAAVHPLRRVPQVHQVSRAPGSIASS